MASNGQIESKGQRFFQEMEDAEILDFPVKSIPQRRAIDPRARPRAIDLQTHTRAQEQGQEHRARAKDLQAQL